jgi:ribosomal protein L22
MIRGRYVQEALDILRDSPKAVAKTIENLVRVGIANAENTHDVLMWIRSISKKRMSTGSHDETLCPRAWSGDKNSKSNKYITVILDEKI